MPLCDLFQHSVGESLGLSQLTLLTSPFSNSNGPLSSQMSVGPQESSVPTKSYDLLQDIFTYNFEIGVHILVFSEDINLLRHAINLHGLSSVNMDVVLPWLAWTIFNKVSITQDGLL